jgi:hypothetical protein
MDFKTEYGFAYITHHRERWSYSSGSFLFLYGLSQGLSTIIGRDNDILPEDTGEEDEGYINSAFFVLDEEGKPVAVLESITIPSALAPFVGMEHGGSEPHNTELRDLWHIEYKAVPTFNFETV